jgi:peptide/nickel transport system substrate-binding protein
MIKIKNRFIYFLKLIIILLIFFNLILSGCFENIKDNEFKNDFEINIGINQDISGFYPWIIRDTISLSVNQNFFNPLVEIDNETRGIIPALAKDWNNPDDLTWRFFLRKDVKFHNGDDFTAEDVKFTLDYLMNYSFYMDRFSLVSNITILDNYTIDIETSDIDPLLLYDLILVNILSKDYMISIMDNNESWPIGTGAYKLKEYIPDDHITLERFDDYWKDKPQIKLVNFVVLDDYNDLFNGLANDSLDISPIAFDDIEDIVNDDDLKLLWVETPGVVYLSFDFRVNDSYGFPGEKNPVSDLRVRKAIYHTIDISEFIENKMNISSRSPASQFITSKTFGYNPNIKRFEHDVEKAREFMKDAGFEEGFNITLDCPDSENAIDICNRITNHLKLINITVVLNPLPYNENLAKLYYKNTSFYITSISPLTAEGSIRLLLHSSDMDKGLGIWNYGNYSNSEIDVLSDLIHNTTDPSVRKSLIQDVFSLAMDDVAWIPMYSSNAFYGVRQNIYWNPRPSLYIVVEEINIKE